MGLGVTTWVLLVHSVGLDGTPPGRSADSQHLRSSLHLCLLLNQSLPKTLDRQLDGSAPPESRSLEPWACLPGLQEPTSGATPPGPRHEHLVHSEAPVHLRTRDHVSLFAHALSP